MTSLDRRPVSTAVRRGRKRERGKRLRIAISHLLRNGQMSRGAQTLLAQHFGLTRQRVHQIVVEERSRLNGERRMDD